MRRIPSPLSSCSVIAPRSDNPRAPMKREKSKPSPLTRQWRSRPKSAASEKMGARGWASGCARRSSAAAWQQGQRLITDPAADLEVVAAIRAQGVEVVISA